MKSYETLTVGQIVADKYEAANVFEKYGIDYCCHGSTPLLEACKNANVELDQVQKELENTPSSAYGNIDFTNWPIDLLIDYILKSTTATFARTGQNYYISWTKFVMSTEIATRNYTKYVLSFTTRSKAFTAISTKKN